MQSARRADCLGLLCHMLSMLCLICYLCTIVAVLISVEVNVNIKKERMIIQSLEFLSKNVVLKNEYFEKESNYVSMASLNLQDHRKNRHILIRRDLLRFSGLLASCLNHAECQGYIRLFRASSHGVSRTWPDGISTAFLGIPSQCSASLFKGHFRVSCWNFPHCHLFPFPVVLSLYSSEDSVSLSLQLLPFRKWSTTSKSPLCLPCQKSSLIFLQFPGSSPVLVFSGWSQVSSCGCECWEERYNPFCPVLVVCLLLQHCTCSACSITLWALLTICHVSGSWFYHRLPPSYELGGFLYLLLGVKYWKVLSAYRAPEYCQSWSSESQLLFGWHLVIAHTAGCTRLWTWA